MVNARVAPVAEIRLRFPALERVHNGNRAAYFDGPGGTQVPQSVVEAMVDGAAVGAGVAGVGWYVHDVTVTGTRLKNNC